MSVDMLPENVDVVVVGSGPAGSAYARTVRDTWPDARILIIEAGPRLDGRMGGHVANLPAVERVRSEQSSQGNARFAYAPITEAEWAARRNGEFDASLLRRPGLFVVNPSANNGEGFAGFASAGIGGMGVHWTAGCPRPAASELVPFIPAHEQQAALDRAERLFGVDTDPQSDNPTSRAMIATLGQMFDAGRPPDRAVRAMPFAVSRAAGGYARHGTDVILGELVNEPEELFRIVPETICRRIVVEGRRAVGIEVLHQGEMVRIAAGAVVVAADSLHTPQLLWASGIRSVALGRYLNEHVQVSQLVELTALHPLEGMVWVPYVGPDFPFSVSIGGVAPDALPFPIHSPRQLAFVQIFCATDPVAHNHLSFDVERGDWRGLPAIDVAANLTTADHERLAAGKALTADIANLIGRPAEGFAPAVPPLGSSLHYQGTMRIGQDDDGTSVCDRHSRVWGFNNLFVAGNGVIPTVTATNPTLFTVALAVLGAQALAAERRCPTRRRI
jgi:choline dehydrogenase-like flavoprotein